jgi:hypothetical protein
MAPAPVPQPASAAPLPSVRPAESAPEPSRQIAALDTRASDAPQPPRRPAELPLLGQVAALNVPLPPMRPMELRPPEPRLAEIRLPEPRPVEPRVAELRLSEQRMPEPHPEPTRIARAAELPSVIMGPATPAAAAPAPALAYVATPEPPAPAPRPTAGGPRPAARAPAVRTDLVAAKTDRATLAALIKAVSVAQLPAPAKTAPGANRAEMTRTIFAQPAQGLGGFNQSPGNLSTGAFTGPAVAALGREPPARDLNTLARRLD